MSGLPNTLRTVAAATDNPDIAAGAQVVVCDEECLVRSVQSERDRQRLEVSGTSRLVRDKSHTPILATTLTLERTVMTEPTPCLHRQRHTVGIEFGVTAHASAGWSSGGQRLAGRVRSPHELITSPNLRVRGFMRFRQRWAGSRLVAAWRERT